MNLPGAVSNARLPERVRSLITLVNLHYAAAGVLLLLNLYLAVALVLAWRATSESGAAALEQQQVALRTAQVQARPLEGLDTKLLTATSEADAFYDRRLPVTYSQVLTELGVLTKRQGIKFSRVGYVQSPVLAGTPGALTEVRVDASLTGDYRSLVLFINSLERDQMFFMVRTLALSSQQSGTVGLRLSFTTFLRPGLIDESTSPLDEGAATVGAAAGTADAAGEEAPEGVTRQAVVRPAAASARSVSAGSASSTRGSSRPFAPPPGGPPEVQTGNPTPEGASQP